MGVPYPDNSRISSDKERTTHLFPIRDHTATLLHLDKVIQPPERTDHLNWALFRCSIIIAEEADKAVGCKQSILDLKNIFSV